MNKLGMIGMILIALAGVFSGIQTMSEANQLNQITRNVSSQADDSECTQVIETIDGDQYPHEVCK